MNMLTHRRTTSFTPDFWKGYWKHSVGFDRMVNTLTRIIDDQNAAGTSDPFEGNYPPYDIIKDSDYNYRIVMAVAGFTEDDINVEKKEQVLIIRGETTITDSYIYKGISSRKFQKVFPLAEGADIVSASLKNGLLEINIEVTIPEDKKPKLIPISNN